MRKVKNVIIVTDDGHVHTVKEHTDVFIEARKLLDDEPPLTSPVEVGGLSSTNEPYVKPFNPKEPPEPSVEYVKRF